MSVDVSVKHPIHAEWPHVQPPEVGSSSAPQSHDSEHDYGWQVCARRPDKVGELDDKNLNEYELHQMKQFGSGSPPG